MSSNGHSDVALRRRSVVVVSGKLPNGEEVFQELELGHDPGTPSSVLIGNAFAIIRQVGGLSTDSADKSSLDFYPLSKFDKVNFTVKNVQLATNLSIQ
jgi:hypothetical protein